MKTLVLICLLASFSVQARGHASPNGLQRSPSIGHRSFMFTPLHHARPDLKGRPLHELSIGKRRQLHREGLDNTVSVFI